MPDNQEYLELIHGLTVASQEVCAGIDIILSDSDDVTVTVGDLRVPLTAIKIIIELQSRTITQAIELDLQTQDRLDDLLAKLKK